MPFEIPGYDDWRADYTTYLERHRREPDPEETDDEDGEFDSDLGGEG